MKNTVSYTILISILSLTFTNNAYAYLDPGTGSIILQGIIGAVAAGSAAVGLYWNQVKLYFKSHVGNADENANSEHKGVSE
jgi:uncharacterized membrane protein